MKYMLNNRRYVLPAIAALALTTSASAAFIPLETFDSLAVGSALSEVGGWNGNATGNTEITIQQDPVTGSNAMYVPAQGNLRMNFDLGSYAVADQSVATLFYSFSRTGGALDQGVGFAAGPVAAPADQGAYTIHKGPTLTARNGGGDASASSGFEVGTSYNVWLVLNNQAGTADTYDVWVQGGAGAYATQSQLYSNLNVRTGSADAYEVLFLHAFLNNSGGELYLDNFHIDLTGENLSAIPEPGTYAAIFGLLALAGVMVRRRLKA